MTNNVEKCENCGNAIGKLETPQVWGAHVVCWDCHKKLLAQQEEKDAAERAAALADYEKTARKELREEASAAVAPEAESGTDRASGSAAKMLTPDVPGYGFLSALAACFMALGILALVIGIAMAVIAGFIFLTPSPQDRSATGMALGIGLNCILGGISSCAFSQLLRCIRDIARNSWIIAAK